MEKFLLAAPDLVEGLSAEAFEDFKESLSLLFLENFKEMDEEACYLWSGIDDTRLGFDLYVKDAAMVKTLHKEVSLNSVLCHSLRAESLLKKKQQELLDMLRQSISSEGAQRSKLSIRVGSQRLMPDYHAEPLGQVLRDQACTSAMMSRFQELIKEAPTVEELLKALSLDSATSQGHAIIEAAGELLRGKPTKGDLRVEDIPSLHKILEVMLRQVSSSPAEAACTDEHCVPVPSRLDIHPGRTRPIDAWLDLMPPRDPHEAVNVGLQ